MINFQDSAKSDEFLLLGSQKAKDLVKSENERIRRKKKILRKRNNLKMRKRLNNFGKKKRNRVQKLATFTSKPSSGPSMKPQSESKTVQKLSQSNTRSSSPVIKSQSEEGKHKGLRNLKSDLKTVKPNEPKTFVRRRWIPKQIKV